MNKITVKHIIVKSVLKNEKDFSIEQILEDGTKVPVDFSNYHVNRLYVKVTFNRKTTQFKSIVEDNVGSLKVALDKYASILNSEKKLITDLVQKGFNTHGDKFSLKGLHNMVRKYNHKTYNDILVDRITDLFKIIDRIESPFKNLRFINKDIDDYNPLIILEAYLKLFDNHGDIKQLSSDFNALAKYYELMVVKGHTSSTFMEWKYGQDRDNFIEQAKLAGWILVEIRDVITFIDNSIDHIVKKE